MHFSFPCVNVSCAEGSRGFTKTSYHGWLTHATMTCVKAILCDLVLNDHRQIKHSWYNELLRYLYPFKTLPVSHLSWLKRTELSSIKSRKEICCVNVSPSRDRSSNKIRQILAGSRPRTVDQSIFATGKTCIRLHSWDVVGMVRKRCTTTSSVTRFCRLKVAQIFLKLPKK